MSKSEIEDHIIEVYERAYTKVKGLASFGLATCVERDQAKALLTQAAARLTQTIIEAERDQR